MDSLSVIAGMIQIWQSTRRVRNSGWGHATFLGNFGNFFFIVLIYCGFSLSRGENEGLIFFNVLKFIIEVKAVK